MTKKAKKKNKKKNNKPKEVVELDFSKCDFPIKPSRPDLAQNWYEFNDSSVTPIYPGTLQSKFGGNSSDGNAYMLVYRQKSLGKNQTTPTMPEYFKMKMETLNEVEEQSRGVYNDLKL